MKGKETTIHTFFFKCWWTVLFILFCYGFYLHGMHKKKELFNQLLGKVQILESQFNVALEKRDDLLLQIESQNDPAWTEMLIKKQLGMVPSGQIKVYFEKE